jgi:DNA ligase-1
MKKVFVEPKFDGLRIQIHYKAAGFRDRASLAAAGGEIRKVKAFTRNLNETSWMFPELIQIEKYINASEVILDTEAVGVDEERKAMANFQTTMTRRRKHDIENISKKVSIRFNVFDVMLKNGKSFVNETYEERRKILADTINNSGTLIDIVDYEITESPEKISELMQKELGEGLEGIIVKRADSKYIAGRTGWRWVKMKEKEAQAAKLADTVDLIVMGYTAGKGKRVSFGLGQFLVGVRDKDEVKTVTKVGTGLTDIQFKELKKRLLGLEVKEKPKNYLVNKLQEPDFWVVPEVVVEIAADEITKSPSHTSGYALRFPRLIKFRDDKSAEQATTVSEIENLFRLQKGK